MTASRSAAWSATRIWVGSSGRWEPPSPRCHQDTAAKPQSASARRGHADGGAPSPLLITSGTPSALLLHERRAVPSRLITPSVEGVPGVERDVRMSDTSSVTLSPADSGRGEASDRGAGMKTRARPAQGPAYRGGDPVVCSPQTRRLHRRRFSSPRSREAGAAGGSGYLGPFV